VLDRSSIVVGDEKLDAALLKLIAADGSFSCECLLRVGALFRGLGLPLPVAC
jgi:hypothetical protein